VVDPFQLTADLAGNTIFLALPALLWLFLYLWAWEHREEARAAGFGRRVFWLLLPGCVLASLADQPLLVYHASVLAVNLGGALIPLVLSVYLVRRWAGPTASGELGRAILALGLLTAVLFPLALLPVGPGNAGLGRFEGGPLAGFPPILLFALVLLAGWVLGALAFPRPTATEARVSPGYLLFLLASLALLLIYATTTAIPGLGIVSSFPEYLFPPVLVGLLGVLLVRPSLGLPRVAGLSFGYAAATFGSLIGADVLHQPPLYGGPPGVLAIGGAGVLDLVYLSGLLAASVGFVALRFATTFEPTALPAPAAPPPFAGNRAELWGAARRLGRGDPAGAVGAALATVEAAFARVRRLWGLSPAGPSDDPLIGLGTPVYISHDLANLRALAARSDIAPIDAARAIRMGEAFLTLAGELERPRFAPLGRRVGAFLVDFSLLTVPALLLWSYLILRSTSGALAVLSSVPYGTALIGYAAAAVLYFVLAEGLFGTTVGKRLFGIEVRNRDLSRPGPVPTLLRNVPRVVPAAIVYQLVGFALVYLLAPSGAPPNALGLELGAATGVFLLVLAGIGLFLSGMITAATILYSPERERIGDVWAGTWVIPSRAAPAPARAALPGAVPPGVSG
jgi:uncharacterized membrane protein/uncharacterized RDD family membrane protein YckC